MHIRQIDQFNIVIVGTGGQGLITLLQIIAEAALASGFDVKTSELHGLSQRGGSVEVHIRFGKNIYSPLVAQGKADLIVALEMQESLKTAYFANSKTKFLINKHIIPILLQKTLIEEQVSAALKKVSKNLTVVGASEICQKELGTGVTAGVYLVSLAAAKKLLPLSPDSILKAVKEVIPKQHLDINLKTFALAKKYAKT
ncbi:MAG: indolepyruvate ferredoxin oxidoreductase subunit beta [Candidatus Nealsonbacteria bacterium CG09_land_8_20_14_0_10_42_14]|uniref:Indolepyruvate ferredoxin oxidoreductase subunit beta n=1 Tax=Candidatus Nealsonbacteria bacterium CG09_land_8_20_14_0_10_42_14 TaxID=1974707 RepID=A0A2H0WX80_9BACT|nr:MAG: indolepyruvate ferredoxin oxidoreductase subunit beta [Candidatus Nealsonbacteria bacterium CG09_land_8_20_14_0_10_42_14]